MDETIYLSFEDILTYYGETIEQNGGGISGIREKDGIEKILDFVQNDLYYPSLEDKLTYLVFMLSVQGITLQMEIKGYR